MIALLLLLNPLLSQVETTDTSMDQPATVYHCSYYASAADMDDDNSKHPEVLQLVAKPAAAGKLETWALKWTNKPEFEALAVNAEFGSIGGSRALRWKDDKSTTHVGFISFSDVVAEGGSKGLWFALDHPSLWQPPGYECETDRKMLTGKSR